MDARLPCAGIAYLPCAGIAHLPRAGIARLPHAGITRLPRGGVALLLQTADVICECPFGPNSKYLPCQCSRHKYMTMTPIMFEIFEV